MSQGSVDVRITGTSKELNAVLNDAFSQLQDFADRATGGFTSGIFTLLFEGIDQLIKAYQTLQPLYQEQIESEIRLQAVLKSTGESAGFTSDQLQVYAEQMQNVIGVEDHLILNTLAVQATFERIQGNNFQRAAEAAFDMSAVLGTDLRSSVIRVGRALEDPIRGMERLERISITFSQSQKDLIRTLAESNKLFEAQEIILEELENRFGGAAEAIGDTFGKQVDILGFQLRNIGEDIFAIFVPAMLEVVGVMRLAADWVQATVNELQKLSTELGETVDIISFIGKRLSDPFVVMSQAIILTISSLAVLENRLRGGNATFKETFEATAENIKLIFKSINDDVDDLLGDFNRFNDQSRDSSSAGQRTPIEKLAKDIEAAAFKEDGVQEDQLEVQKQIRDGINDLATTGGVAGPGFQLG